MSTVISSERYGPVYLKQRERRLKIIWIADDMLLNCLFHEQHRRQVETEIVSAGIPADCYIDAVCYSDERRAFGIRIYHESFPIVEPYCMTPDVQVTFRLVTKSDSEADKPELR